MKKSLIALAALAATGAFAQSSVTIDGFVQLGVQKLNDQAATIDALNGTTQIRFRGTEDLGGGLKAHFTLAQRISPESGKNDGTTFGRPLFQGESSLGLSGNFGALKVGRALHGLNLYIHNTDPFGLSYLGSTAVLPTGYAADNDRTANFPGSTVSTQGGGWSDGGGLGRTDAISYVSPAISGFTVAAAVAPKRSQGVTQAKSYQSLWVNYAQGALTVGGGTEKARDGVGKVTAFNATYDLGVVKLGAGFGNVTANVASVAGLPAIVVGNELKTWNAMAVAPFGATTLKLSYGVATNDTTNVDVSKKLGLGLDYNLSKRTSLYTTAFRDSAAITRAGAKNGTEVGVRHAF